MTGEGEVKHLGVVDLVVLCGSIVLAVLVGAYYAVVDRKKSVDNYYYGGRNMSPIPVGLSIAVSFISAITVIGFPAETYLFGVIMLWFGITTLVPNIIACIYYIPLIHRLKLATIYEVVYMAMTIYVPALALNAVTPVSLLSTIAICTLTCSLYTTFGGMKAVIWTDTFQTGAMVAGGTAAMIKALIEIGGIGNAVDASARGGRLNFLNFNPDPTVRYTIFTFVIGKAIGECGLSCVNQSIAQRYLSCKTVTKARVASLISVIPFVCFSVIAVVTGMAMYAFYEGCDPLSLGKIDKPDQLLPYLVVEMFQDLPGLAGLFVAAAFSGTLSSVSSGLNSLSVMILHDFVLMQKPNLSSTFRLTLSKLIVFGLGLLVFGVAYCISFFQATILRIIMSLAGVLSGPTLGVFTLGIFFPWSNAKGAVVGQLAGSLFTGWIAFGSLSQGSSSPSNRPLPLSTDSCPTSINATATSFFTTNPHTIKATTVDSLLLTTTTTAPSGGLSSTLYSISFLYYAVIALVVTIIFGLIASFLTGANDPEKADAKLFVPFVDNKRLPEKVLTFFRFGVPQLPESFQNNNMKSFGNGFEKGTESLCSDSFEEKEKLTSSDKESVL